MKPAQTILLCALLTVGCGKTDKAGETVGEHITEFTRAIGKGVDKKLMVNVTLSAEVQSLGLTHTTAKAADIATSQKAITVYFIASKDVDSTLKAQAFNAEDAEIGRTKLPVKLAKDEAAYITIEFPKEMDSMTVKEYRIGL